MSWTTLADRTIAKPDPAGAPAPPRRLGPTDVLVLSTWCGLAAGLMEVGLKVLLRSIDPTKRMYLMSRHFVWLAPLIYLLLSLGIGLCLAMFTRLWPRRGGWLSLRLIGAGATLPVLKVVGPQIYTEAWVLLGLGIAARLAPALERQGTALRRWLIGSLPVLLGVVLLLAASVFGSDHLKRRREAARPLPPAGSPNVLLIVLDTVRADHLSLHGYQRPTSPTLDRLARRGIRFDEARATAPWTLPSHASMFTGRWPRELAVKWLTPLQGNFPTLAEYLGAHGYATAGFVANHYCSYDTGLDRGFTHYEDYLLEQLSPFRTAGMVDLTLNTLADMGVALSRHLDAWPLRPLQAAVLRRLLARDRKGAGSVNREFLDWLEQRQQPGRPFFVFLNYFDAHTPYVLPTGAAYRVGPRPRTQADLQVLERWAELDKLRLPQPYRTLARDSYDNCLSYLDARLGDLFDELERRSLLDRTLVIITSDHGEELGDHDLFDHGESLYRPEIHVPLLIVLPSHNPSGRIVSETVSLRDLPATVADLVGLGSGSPFPGRSVAPLWSDSPSGAAPVGGPGFGALSELASPNPTNPNQGRSPAHRGPLISLAEGGLVYIRNEGSGDEELYDVRDDPRELLNRAHVDAMRPVLQRFRERLEQIKAGAREPMR
jgi:arylsulfatase A-like enzyme